MMDSRSHLRRLKRRLTQPQEKENMSPEEKVNLLEQTLSVFRAEVDMKLDIIQQILTTRNEQVKSQKKMLDREQTLYNTLLGHWKNAPKLATTGISVNISTLDIIGGEESDEPESDPDYFEVDEDELSPGPSRKKSKSSLRRQRNSSKTILKRQTDSKVGIPDNETEVQIDDDTMLDPLAWSNNEQCEGEEQEIPQDPPSSAQSKESTHKVFFELLKGFPILLNKSQVPAIKDAKHKAYDEICKLLKQQSGKDHTKFQVSKKLHNMKQYIKNKTDMNLTSNQKIQLKDWEKDFLVLLKSKAAGAKRPASMDLRNKTAVRSNTGTGFNSSEPTETTTHGNSFAIEDGHSMETDLLDTSESD